MTQEEFIEKKFLRKREIIQWGTCGKKLDEPMKLIKLKDLSDSHLLHIIAWIKLHKEYYQDEILALMEKEQLYRCENFIFVPEYK